MCFIIGQLVAAGVLDGLVKISNEWSYRAAFALQWFWPAFLFPTLLFMPELPWHLVRKGRLDEAEKSLVRLQSKNASVSTKETLAMTVHTNEMEMELSAGTSYFDCFKGSERRRTEIACVAFAGQMFAGAPFAYNSTYFFQQIGFNTQYVSVYMPFVHIYQPNMRYHNQNSLSIPYANSTSRATYNLNVGGTSMGLAGTLVSWFCIMPYVGRRKTYLVGICVLTTILLVIGLLNIGTSHKAIATAQACLTLIWTFIFQLSVGQLGWAIPAEIGSTRLRQKTVCLARNSCYVMNVVANVLEPYFMNPTGWNLKGYTGFFWGGLAGCTTVWTWFRLPETKGRTFEDLGLPFARGVSARKFGLERVDSKGSDVFWGLAKRRCKVSIEIRRVYIHILILISGTRNPDTNLAVCSEYSTSLSPKAKISHASACSDGLYIICFHSGAQSFLFCRIPCAKERLWGPSISFSETSFDMDTPAISSTSWRQSTYSITASSRPEAGDDGEGD